MECPVCKNTRGFACGTCIECGFNYLDKTFHYIEIRTELLKQLVTPDVFAYLVAEHRRQKEN
jgi:hypothetical protein